jgi:gamma-D-glutamyl-L-lysine dipeptidyl-peptidase
MNEKAICKISVIPVRAEHSDRSEIVSQLLFGETCTVIEKYENWCKIKCDWDDYEGWIDGKQIESLQKNFKTEHLTFQLAHSCHKQDNHIPLLLGSSLPDFDGLNFSYNKEKYIFNGITLKTGTDNLDKIKKIAMKYHNAPYLWGGRSPFGIDCSGLTQMIYKFLDIKLPRDAYQQAEMGDVVNFAGEARTGDLAFFGNEEKITHVGMIMENGNIIHASGYVRIDILDHVGIYNADIKKYTHKLKVIKRIIDRI